MLEKTLHETSAQPLSDLMIANMNLVGDDGSLAKWRKTLLMRMLSVLAVLGWCVGAPSFVLVVSEALWSLAWVAVVVPLALTGLYMLRDRNNVALSIALLLILYLLGVVVLANHGLMAIIYLLPLPILAVLLVSQHLAFWVTLVNTLTLFFIGYMMKIDSGIVAVSDVPMLHWFIIACNFLLSNAMLVWACAFLLRGLDTILIRQRESVRALKENAQKLEHMATHDNLTGLANRRLLKERIGQAMQASAGQGKGMVAVVLMDLDHFKTINDTYGHQLGDELIVAVAQRLQASARPVDTVARLGGDEFVVLLNELSDDKALHTVVNRILNNVHGDYALTQRTVHVSTSMGVAVFPRDGDDEQTLLKSADIAMYRAKELGRNRAEFFHADMKVRLQ